MVGIEVNRKRTSVNKGEQKCVACYSVLDQMVRARDCTQLTDTGLPPLVRLYASPSLFAEFVEVLEPNSITSAIEILEPLLSEG